MAAMIIRVRLTFSRRRRPCPTAPAPTSPWCWSASRSGLWPPVQARWLVGVGIALIVLGALLLPFAAGIPSNEKSPPAGKRWKAASANEPAVNRVPPRSPYSGTTSSVSDRRVRSLSRKRTFALLAAFAALAALLSACGGGGGSSSSEDPQKVIESATFEGVESGDLGLTMNVKSEGENGGEMKIDVSGPVPDDRQGSLPNLPCELKANGEADGENVDIEGGITVLNDRAYIGYKGKEYEVEPATFGFIKSGFESSEPEGESYGDGSDRLPGSRRLDRALEQGRRRPPERRRW